MSHDVAIRIFVCGDGDRGDSGAPLIAVSRLLPGLPRAILDHVEIRRREHLDVGDLVDMGAGEASLILDTAVGVEPGAVITITLVDMAARPSGPLPRSLPASRIDAWITSLSEAEGSVLSGAFVGIGGRSFGFGMPLSIPVRAAMPAFSAAIAGEIARILRGSALDAR